MASMSVQHHMSFSQSFRVMPAIIKSKYPLHIDLGYFSYTTLPEQAPCDLGTHQWFEALHGEMGGQGPLRVVSEKSILCEREN
jgi:hypothetical protein